MRMAAWAAPRRGRSSSTPPDWELDLAPLIGAPMVYQQLRTWMETGAGTQVRDHGPDDGVCGADRAHLAQAVMTAPTTRRLRVADRSAA